jgi:phosphoribosylaminoimidazole (AIR) synthetase
MGCFLYTFFQEKESGNMKELLQRITKLIDVKSIMTLTLTIVFAVLVLRGNVTNEQYMTIFTMIVGFYFGVQSAKNS